MRIGRKLQAALVSRPRLNRLQQELSNARALVVGLYEDALQKSNRRSLASVYVIMPQRRLGERPNAFSINHVQEGNALVRGFGEQRNGLGSVFVKRCIAPKPGTEFDPA